jgi:hypothetical protein
MLGLYDLSLRSSLEEVWKSGSRVGEHVSYGPDEKHNLYQDDNIGIKF